jgi:prepilin-type N-terminal cleavage/methylation domain-containing protein
MKSRSGLTLIEMLVVLTILAITTTLAVVLTEGAVDQARFNSTQQQLQAISDAIIGPASNPDAPAFLADIGRLPLASVNPLASTTTPQLVELWSNVNGLASYGQVTTNPVASVPALSGWTSTSLSPNVSLFAGWRGPYLRLAPGQTQLFDGWGAPFNLLQTNGTVALNGLDGTAAVTGSSIGQVYSTGAPAAQGVTGTGALTPYAVTQALPAPFLASTPNIWTGTVSGSVYNTNTTGTVGSAVTVCLFVPDLTQPTGIRVMTYVTSTSSLAFTFPVPSTDPYYPSADANSKLSVPIGPKALRAYQTAAQTASGTATASSVIYLKVPAGGISPTINFYVQ